MLALSIHHWRLVLVCAWPFVLVLSDVVLLEIVLVDRWVVLAPLDEVVR